MSKADEGQDLGSLSWPREWQALLEAPSHGVKLAGDDADDFVIWGQHTLRTKAGKGRDKDPEK